MLFRSKGKMLKNPVKQNAVVVMKIDEIHTSTKMSFFGQDNLIRSADNSPKEAATTVNTNMLTGITGGNDSVTLHLDPVKT